MSCHKSIVEITGRAHCFYDYIYGYIHANKDLAGVAWDREDYIKEGEKQLGVAEVYEEVSNDTL